jgi:hypothetical protein
MQGYNITPASMYVTGIISRRPLLDLLNGTGTTRTATAISLASHFTGTLITFASGDRGHGRAQLR